jgi:hypothetical protein
VDRINNKLGYEKNNIWIVHKNINQIRNKLSVKDFIFWCNLINKPIKYNIKNNSCIKIKHGNHWKGYENISRTCYNNILTNNNKRSYPRNINITIEYLWKLFLKQKGYCALTGYPLEWGTKEFNYANKTASLDRIDSSKGYCKNNVQWVHKNINLMKWDYPQDEFIRWCKLVAQHTSTPEWQAKYGHLLKEEKDGKDNN